MGFSLARAAFEGLGEATDSGSCGGCGRAGFAGAGVQRFRGGVWGRVGARRMAGRAGKSGGSLHCPLNEKFAIMEILTCGFDVLEA